MERVERIKRWSIKHLPKKALVMIVSWSHFGVFLLCCWFVFSSFRARLIEKLSLSLSSTCRVSVPQASGLRGWIRESRPDHLLQPGPVHWLVLFMAAQQGPAQQSGLRVSANHKQNVCRVAQLHVV